MNTNLLTPNKDPMGYAIADYHAKGKAGKLRVFSSQFEEDEIPVSQLFRTYDEMPDLEQEALQLAQGKILDCVQAGYKLGDKVVSMTAAGYCGHCDYCRAGLYMLCKEKRGLGSARNGAFAEYMTYPADRLFKIPEGVSMKAAALSEPLACCLRGMDLLGMTITTVLNADGGFHIRRL